MHKFKTIKSQIDHTLLIAYLCHISYITMKRKRLQNTCDVIIDIIKSTLFTYFNIFDLAFSAFFLWINSMSTRLFLKTLPKKYCNVKVDDSLKFCLVMINLIRIQTNNNTLKVNTVCTSLYLLSRQLGTYSQLQIGRLSGKRKLVYNINILGKNCIQWKMLSCNNNIYFTVGSRFQYLTKNRQYRELTHHFITYTFYIEWESASSYME